jgi:hypothetical protein
MFHAPNKLIDWCIGYKQPRTVKRKDIVKTTDPLIFQSQFYALLTPYSRPISCHLIDEK